MIIVLVYIYIYIPIVNSHISCLNVDYLVMQIIWLYFGLIVMFRNEPIIMIY